VMPMMARLSDAPISTKHVVEIARCLRGKELKKAMAFLERVIEGKQAVPFKRYNRDTPHRKGMGPGRYPKKASSYMLKLLKDALNNAIQKGMNPEKLFIKRIEVGMAISKHRRARRGLGKRTHVLVEVEERD